MVKQDPVTSSDAAFLYGTSGGAVIPLEAVTRGLGATKLALWEPPYGLDGEPSRPRPPADYEDQLVAAVAGARRGDAVELFFTAAVGMPAEFVAGMRQAPFWQAMESRAQALVYDAAIMGDFRVPVERLGKVDVPVLVIDGATTPWMSRSADTVASAVPGAKRRTLEGQPHNADPAAIAPALVEFFAAEAPPRSARCEPGGGSVQEQSFRLVHRGVPAQRGKLGFELLRAPRALDDVIPASVRELSHADPSVDPGPAPGRSPAFDAGRMAGCRRGLLDRNGVVGEEHPAARRQRRVHELPEDAHTAGRNMGEPEPERDGVESAWRAPGVEVRVDEGDPVGVADLAAGDCQRLRRGIHGRDVTGHRGQLAGQVAGPGGQF